MDKPGFHLDEDVLSGSSPANKVPYLNHGKQVARNRAGIWFCGFIFDRAFHDRNWLALAVSDTPQQEGSEFEPAILLLGRSEPHLPAVLPYAGGFLNN